MKREKAVSDNKYNEVMELLVARTKPKGNSGFTNLTSWLVDDEEYVPILAGILESNCSKALRRECYALLFELYSNTKNLQSRELLWSGLLHEKDSSILGTTLQSLDSIPNAVIFNRVCELIEHPQWGVRFDAVTALKFSEEPAAEALLLKRLAVCENAIELTFIIATLLIIGTVISIPALSVMMGSRSPDVCTSAIGAIGRISRRCSYNPTELYSIFLNKTKSYQKYEFTLNSLCFVGDASAVGLVQETLGKIFSRDKRRYETSYCLDLDVIIDYLLRNDGREATAAFCKAIVEKYAENLQEHELLAFRGNSSFAAES